MMKKTFNSKAFYEMEKLRNDIEEKVNENKNNKPMQNIYKDQLKIINRCINSLYM